MDGILLNKALAGSRDAEWTLVVSRQQTLDTVARHRTPLFADCAATPGTGNLDRTVEPFTMTLDLTRGSLASTCQMLNLLASSR
jgi:hypothetical protein